MTGEMHNRGIYEKYVKRLFDIICSAAFMIVFCWLYAIIALLVYIKIGKPIIFKQPRPGNERENILHVQIQNHDGRARCIRQAAAG